MFNKIFLSFLFLLFLLNSYYLFAKDIISVEAKGYSIIENDIGNCREKAINEALKKAVEKVANQEVENYQKYVEGFEIIDEQVNGNILNEIIKVEINISLLKKDLQIQSAIPIYLMILTLNDKDNSLTFDPVFFEKLSKFSKNLIANVTIINLIEPVPVFFSTNDLMNYAKKNQFDILIIGEYKIESEKKIYSVDKKFSELAFRFYFFDNKLNLIEERVFSKKIISSINENPILKIKPEDFAEIKKIISKQVQNFLSLKKEEIASKNVMLNKYYFILEKPKDFFSIKKICKIFDKYSINYNFYEIRNRKIIFLIKNFPQNELLKIFQNEELRYSINKQKSDELIIYIK